MKRVFKSTFALLNIAAATILSASCQSTAPAQPVIKVPDGFKTAVIADNIGKARHIAMTSNGNLYVKLASPVNGKGILMLQDADGDGTYTVSTAFGGYGGTGLYLKDGYLYASSNTEVFRYKLDVANTVTDAAQPEKLVTGLIDRGQHETKSLVVDNSGNLLVNIGAFSNSCQIADRQKGSMGRTPCPVLDSAGGIWQFKINKLNQGYNSGVRYATGLRNVVGLDWNNQDNSLYVMQHGRDQLDMFPGIYTTQQSASLPAETMYKIKQGDNAGWPYAFFDPVLKKKILAPEYGGDGKKEGDAKFIDPVVAFPAHIAPNALLFYTGTQFPERYRNGAFIAFHGSWNRSPEPQAGYFVAFVPFKNGSPAGEWEIFADGFAGVSVVNSTRQAQHRPCGLTMGPDGSLYVSDDVKGSIYKISYTAK